MYSANTLRQWIFSRYPNDLIPASINQRIRQNSNMRVRITRQPLGMIQGMSLKYYRPGEVYELPPSLAEYLVMENHAIVEMRDPRGRPAWAEEERRRRL
jgi:hypothetical protein